VELSRVVGVRGAHCESLADRRGDLLGGRQRSLCRVDGEKPLMRGCALRTLRSPHLSNSRESFAYVTQLSGEDLWKSCQAEAGVLS